MSYRSTWDPLSQGVRWRLAAGQTHTTLQIVNLIIIVIVMDPRWSPASQLCCGCYLQLNCLHLDIHLDPAAHRHSVLILYWQNIILEELRKLSLVTTDHSMLTCPQCSVQLYSAPRVRAGGTCLTQQCDDHVTWHVSGHVSPVWPITRHQSNRTTFYNSL